MNLTDITGVLQWGLLTAAIGFVLNVFFESNVRNFLEPHGWDQFLSRVVGKMRPLTERRGFWFAFGLVAGATILAWTIPEIREPHPSTPPATSSSLADPLASFSLLPSEKREAFRQATFTVGDTIGANFTRKVSIIAEDSAIQRARTVYDLFAISGWLIEDHGGGNFIGAPSGYRLAPGITIKAPVPSAAAESARAAFERIGVTTRRGTDRSRTDDYLIVEIGSP